MKIVGITLARNEERFIGRAVRNVIAFCDEMVLLDDNSTDGTPAVFQEIASEYSGKVRVAALGNASESHAFVASHAGTPTWVFAVDGDEIYDPAALVRFRARVERGEFDRDWCVFGNVLNVKELNEAARRARGHLSPPCRSMTKLYNFSAIDAWNGPCAERLHGGSIVFRPGFSEKNRRALHEEEDWDESDFRCLHMCFLPRSGTDRPGRPRANIMDRHAWTLGKVLQQGLAWLSGRRPPNWKEEKYARGPLVEKEVAGFFS